MHRDAGDDAQAVVRYERALTIHERADSQLELARTRFALAETLWDLDRDRPRAIELATSARDTYRSHGSSEADRAGQIEAWLRRSSYER